MKVIAFPFHDWRKSETEGLRTRDLHLLEHFDLSPRIESVLVIDRPVSLVERVLRRRGPFVEGTAVDEVHQHGYHSRITHVRNKLLILDTATPAILGPVIRGRGWWFDAFRDPRVIDSILWAALRTGSNDAGVVAWAPPPEPAIRRLDPRRLVYDSLDNWLIHPALRRHRREATQAYRGLLPRAATVFVSGPASAAALRPFSDRVELLGNGVDPAVFAGTHSRPDDLPPSPLIGYVGKLAERIDANLIKATADRSPDINFVFIGPILSRSAVRPLRGLRNVYLLGDRPYDRLPAYISHFDIAWIPHRVGEGETGGDPIKLYEYWAAGKQVISTRIDGLDALADQIHLVSHKGEGADLIRGLLDGTVPLKSTTVPVDRTWASIADRMISALEAAG